MVSDIDIITTWVRRKSKGELFLVVDGEDIKNEKHLKLSAKFEERKLYETIDTSHVCVISDDDAKGLMDSLWDEGIRPN